MFFYIIHEFVLKSKKSKNKNKKYINTLIFGSILYIISHAFINDESNFLYNYMNYFYCIIVLDIVTFLIKEKLYKLNKNEKNDDIIYKKLEREKNENLIKTNKLKENFNSNNSVFIKNYEMFGNDEIITESFFNTDKNFKTKLKLDSELIESSDKLESSDSVLNSESIEIKSNVISN